MTTMAYTHRVRVSARPQGRAPAFTLAVLATALAVATLAGARILAGPGAVEAHVVPTTLPTQVRLQTADVTNRAEYLIVTGEVRNIGATSLRNLEAVIECRDASGRLTGVTEALTTIPTVSAGATSPFQVYVATDGSVRNCGIRFRTLLGAEVGAAEAPR